MLNVSDLTLSRGERILVRGLSFTLDAGDILALEGANGVGKTTLLRAVAGFVRPDAGAISAPGPLHWLGHLDGLKGHRRARDELAFQAGWSGGSDATGAIARLGLEPLLDLEARRLSAGQRRRLALARFLAAPRPLWLMDEPLAPLDARWRSVVGDLMAEHLATGGAILAAVHDPLPIPSRTLRLEVVA